MANQLWVQDSFDKGELSPYMYARAGVQQYYNGLRKAINVINYPTGAAGKRFGTYYEALLSGFTYYDQIFFQTFHYLNECVYQLLYKPDNIDIFLEGVLIATVTSTGLDAIDCYGLDSTVLQNLFRVSGQGFRPKDLKRAANSPVAITSNTADTFTCTSPAFTAGLIYPVRFSVVGGTGMQTTPQIKQGVTYFVYAVTNDTAEIYTTPQAAKQRIITGVNAGYAISGLGTGTTSCVVLNTWTLTNAPFSNVPIYDFTGGYDAITFTPSATTGASVTLTASGAIFTSAMVGGAFIGGGGAARITVFTDSTHVTVAVQQPFDSTSGILGSLALLAEPAWSDARGWPQKCSSYQNRALFANTDSLSNGFWASAINDYTDFNDLQTDDDNAISWYPTSDEVNYIRFIVPYRSVTVHTNSGVYSSPLSFEAAITPKTFSLQLQDTSPANRLQPQTIDNQIIVVAGNDVLSLMWNGLDNAYTSSIISIMNEQLIRDPLDESPYVDRTRAGSRYIFIINSDGSMAILQTLITENVQGWTPAILEQSYGESKFIQVATDFDGRAWFVVEREIASAASPVNITGFTSSTLTATASDFSTTLPTALRFYTSGSLPSSTPQIEIDTYYWGIGIDANTVKVYLSQEDALADEDGIVFSSAGTSSTIEKWALSSTFMLEQLTFDTHLDCAARYIGTPTSSVNGLARFNAQEVKMVGDGFGFNGIGIDSSVEFEAHGQEVEVSDAYIGFPVRTRIEPMALTIALGRNQNYLTRPKHIRNVNFMFKDTIGGTINGVPIALRKFSQADIGLPPEPSSGVFEMAVMEGWDDFNNPAFVIEHDEPFNMELLGIFYDVDV